MLDAATISIQNLSSTLSDTEFGQIVSGLQMQLQDDYGKSCWVTQGLAVPATLVAVSKGLAPPPGTWHVELLDTSDQPGALGYHEDEAFDNKINGEHPEGHVTEPTKQPRKASAHSSRGLREDATETPLAKVFVKTSQEDGVDPAEVASHEILEMLVDPQVVKEVRTVTVGDRIYIVEVGDPVQGTGYQRGSVTVANFVLPAYFEMEQAVNPEQYDFRGALDSPVPALTPDAYLSYAPVSDPEAWVQEFGTAAA